MVVPQHCCKGPADAAHREGVHVVCLAAQMHELAHVPQLRRRAAREERCDVRWCLGGILLLLGLQAEHMPREPLAHISDRCCVSTWRQAEGAPAAQGRPQKTTGCHSRTGWLS